MKILAATPESVRGYLKNFDRHDMFVEFLPYEELVEAFVGSSDYSAILVDISGDEAEGVYTPRSLIERGHTLPIVGLIDELEFADDDSFDELQTIFIQQGGRYLLRRQSSPDLIRTCLMASSSSQTSQPLNVHYFVYENSLLAVDLSSHKVWVDSDPIHLTNQEYLILELLVLRVGNVVTKESFLNHMYSGIEMPEIKIVDVFVCKLRKKLSPVGPCIETVWGRGYTISRECVAKIKSAA